MKRRTRNRMRHWRTHLAIGLMAVMLLGGAAVAGTDGKLSDKAITHAVEGEFVFDSAVPYNDIDVGTREGIVTLRGRVDNLLSKERAQQIAETVRGVRAVVNEIKVQPAMERSDRMVRMNVKNALLLDPATDSYEVTIDVQEGGVVTLRGTVDSWQERQLCETVAKGAAGVTALKNDIDVNYKTKRQDAEIKPEIERRLRWDTLVDDGLIDVDVSDGKVTLSGTVGSAAEKRRAHWDALVAGVESIDDSDLKVSKWAREDDLLSNKYAVRSDDAIQDAVKDAMLYDPRVLSFNVTATVSNGVVTLEGIVDNAKAKHAAEQDARATVGVVDVKSRIKVRPRTEVADEAIAENVRKGLLLDPVTERYEVTVKVHNGIVGLYGTVDTAFEKMQAEDVAKRSRGVVDVRNHLTVAFGEQFTRNPYVYPFWTHAAPYSTRIPLEGWKSDSAIADDIRDELWWSPYVNESDVTVVVEDGVATLSGTVDTWTEYNAARNNAIEGGALSVINLLEVQ